MSDIESKFKLHEMVQKKVGDYTFEGIVIGIMEKVDLTRMAKTGKLYAVRLNNKVRYAVQNEQGLIHIFSENQLELIA